MLCQFVGFPGTAIYRAVIRSLSVLIMFALAVPAFAQNLPQIKVRFANPDYDCRSQTYCVDVEFQSSVPDRELYGMNVRFFYDDAVLEFKS